MAHPYELYEAYGSPVWAMDPGYESDMDMEVKVLVVSDSLRPHGL